MVWDGSHVCYTPGRGIASSFPHVYNKDGVELTSGVTRNVSHVFGGGWVGPYVEMTTNYTSSEPHNAAIEMMTDDDNGSITGTPGQLIENPADIIHYLLVHYSDLESDEVNLASLGTMRSLLSPAKYASIINVSATGKEILDRLTSQAWCGAIARKGKMDFVTFDRERSPKGPLNLDIWAIGRPVISWDSAAWENNLQVQYALNPSTRAWEGNLTYNKNNSDECARSVEQYGERPVHTIQLTDVQVEITARQMIQRFLDFRAEPHYILSANVPYSIGWLWEEGNVAEITCREGPGEWADKPCVLLERAFADNFIMLKWMAL